MFKKRYLSMLLFVMMLMTTVLFGCSADTQKEDKGEKEPQSSESAAFPVTVKDGSGEEITIKEEPKKIISLLPSNTEIAYSLGLGDKIVGVSDYCNYPEEATKKEKVGGLDMKVEKILELNPDLILLSPSQLNSAKATINQFKEAGMDVLIVPDSNSFKEAYDTIKLVGKATGTTEKADTIIADVKEHVDAMKEKAEAIKDKKKVWVEISESPDLYTTGSNTFLNEMLEVINAENIAGDKPGWFILSEEQVVKRNPDVIITTYGYYIDNPEQKVLNRKGWANVTAVQNKQVIDVNNDAVSRPGPRMVEGIQALGEAVYPEVFKK